MRVWGHWEGAGRPARFVRSAGGLVGRAEELGALRRMLAQGRLVTVVGGAGIGKSLLAEHAATAVGSSMPDGVVRVRWWDGAATRRRSVAQAVADALDGETEAEEAGGAAGEAEETGEAEGVGVGAAGQPAATLEIAALVARLRSRRMLVVLDDFDPVRGECVRLVRALLDEAPDVRVLSAGRHPLGLGEEAVLRLGPLGGAASDGGSDAATGVDAPPGAGPAAGPAATLFLERVRAARRGAGHDGPSRGRPGPTPGDRVDELRLADDICRRLEGMPLAIELAAAQAVQYSLPQLARMLEPAQGWLGVADAPLRRHRSLRAAVGAGYALCGAAERTVWARLSVFAGSFDEDAAAYVCSGGGLDAQDVPASLARLVLASVLEPVRDPGGVLAPRYRMPAAVRGFGAERLQSAGETAAAVSRHLYWYGHVASTAHHLWSTGLHERAASLVRDEEADLRAALTRVPSGADPASATLAVVVDLWFWWAVCGHAEEGRALLGRLLPLARTDTRVCGQALWLAGWLAACADSPEAAELLGQAWRVALLAGDDATVGRVSHVLGALALRDGRTERAIAHLRAAADTIPVHADHGPPAAVSWALLAVAQARVRPADAWRSVRRASAGPQPRHDLWTRSMTQYAQAFVDHLRGRRSRAWRRAHKALAGALGVAGAATASEPPVSGDAVAGAVASMAGPPGVALIHQLIADIESGPPPV
ncbi:ATP-binding protein [Streptomyces atriruber]|uniref:ATP-binding protein n=1 Tax=Streptomyces atriruber TaxID=545121 RepID=UPI0006E166EB|nr:AAA family ATPase [Streptomyces atriruber]